MHHSRSIIDNNLKNNRYLCFNLRQSFIVLRCCSCKIQVYCLTYKRNKVHGTGYKLSLPRTNLSSFTESSGVGWTTVATFVENNPDVSKTWSDIPETSSRCRKARRSSAFRSSRWPRTTMNRLAEFLHYSHSFYNNNNNK